MDDGEYQEENLISKAVPVGVFVILTAVLLASIYYLFFR